MKIGSLFSGIGGFDLGFERAGFEIAWQVEIDPFCQAVLARHWPTVRRYDDVRTIGPELTPVDVIVGGFPCQDISSNNQYKTGISGQQSGLFAEAIRVVRDLRPRYVVLENVADLLVRGMGTVLGELAALGFDADWECLPAAAFGAPQPRWRVFLIAYPRRGGCQAGHEWLEMGPFASLRLDGNGLVAAEHAAASGAARVCGMDDGFPDRMDRVKACGNAIVPQIAEWIARRILDADVATR